MNSLVHTNSSSQRVYPERVDRVAAREPARARLSILHCRFYFIKSCCKTVVGEMRDYHGVTVLSIVRASGLPLLSREIRIVPLQVRRGGENVSFSEAPFSTEWSSGNWVKVKRSPLFSSRSIRRRMILRAAQDVTAVLEADEDDPRRDLSRAMCAVREKFSRENGDLRDRLR